MINNNAGDDFFVSDIKEADPWKVIKASAEGAGIEIRNPKSNCKKCHGRGWIGKKIGSGEPIPCSCIFSKKVMDEYEKNMKEFGLQPKPHNRAERRQLKNRK